SKVNVETVKAESHGLRGSLPEELANGEMFLSEAAKVLIKFHGSYQQEDRDGRKSGEKHYQFMIRSKLPGGQLTGAQYLVHDRIAGDYANDTLRITVRQGFQFHGVIKGELQSAIQAVNEALVTTFGACGDVVRNVTCCPVPTANPQRRIVQDFATYLSDALLPKTRAYHQIWIDGQALIEDEAEPLYGQTYLPRKFKIAITFPGDNCVDVYTNDVGLVALFDDAATLIGFNLLAGGGMGMTHNDEDTFPRLADAIAFVHAEHALEVVRAIVTIHRDFGDRADRKHARLKYVLHEWGVTRFREELQRRVAFALEDPRPLPPFRVDDHLGWHEQGDGRLFLGLPVEGGRIADRGERRLRSALRTIIGKFDLSVRLTPQQNILLTNVHPAARLAIDAILAEHQVRTVEQLSGVRRYGLACPALPTCPLAITEAERVLPGLLDEFEDALAEVGLPNEPINIHMTGCPNGCARPYVAEIGLVGRSLNKYTIFLGGSAIGTRLAESFLDLVPLQDIVPRLKPVLTRFREERRRGETFGDFCTRIGLVALRTTADQQLAARCGPDAGS
ncbi:MAG TPA: NADPH-dependent assimilatory sulfite reductase hemoprotein subunit, partial [Aggregatilineales bacterium]|nr:NADPH-dependent assimilatory sulfite reductase hemoprotein subunit [Aggregatilineales bacterium]